MIFNWTFQSIATSTVQSSVAGYLRKEWGNLNEVTSDNDEGDDDDVNSKDDQVVEIGKAEALTTLDKLVNLIHLSKEETDSLVTMKDKLEKIRVLSEKESHSNDYFMLEQIIRL